MELFTYWEGDIPAHVAACIDIGKAYGLKVYGRDDIDVPDGLLTPHHRADWFRAHKLSESACCWINADAVILRDPRKAIAINDDCDLYGFGWNDRQPSIGLLMSSGSMINAHLWATSQEVTVGTGGAVGWTALGASLLWPIVARSKRCAVAPARYAFAAPWHSAGVLMTSVRSSLAIASGAVCVHLNNQTTGKTIGAAMDNPSTLISQLLSEGRARAGAL